MTWPRTIASSTRALDRPFSSWSFTVAGRPVTVRVAGNRVANDGGVLRQWALDGHGVIMRNDLDIRKELASGALVTALDTFVTSNANLYAVNRRQRLQSACANVHRFPGEESGRGLTFPVPL